MKIDINKALAQVVAHQYPQAAETCDKLASLAVDRVLSTCTDDDYSMLSMARSAAYMLRIEQPRTGIDLLYAMRDLLTLSEAQKS